jgi:hypothetical protein
LALRQFSRPVVVDAWLETIRQIKPTPSRTKPNEIFGGDATPRFSLPPVFELLPDNFNFGRPWHIDLTCGEPWQNFV